MQVSSRYKSTFTTFPHWQGVSIPRISYGYSLQMFSLMIMVFYVLKTDLKIDHWPYSCKYPILLNRDSYLAELIILKCHLFVLHSGVKDTLNELRYNYWVTRGRQTVKSVIRKCLKCIRQSSRPFDVHPFDVLPTAPLPRFGVDIDFPYSHTGVDYLGPLYVKNIYGSKKGDLYKCHIVLYTYGSTRAVSLDIVPGASCQSFIRSLQRFISRYGIPKLFISDNAKNFVGEELTDYTQSISTN